MTPRYYDSLPKKRESSLSMLRLQPSSVTKNIYVYNFFDLAPNSDISIDKYLAELKIIFYNQKVTKINLDGWKELRDIFTKSTNQNYQNVATENLKAVFEKILIFHVKIDPKKIFELQDDYRDFFLKHLIEACQRVGKIQLANALRLRQQKTFPTNTSSATVPARISPLLFAELQKTIALQSSKSHRTPAQPQSQTTTTTLKRKLDASISTETIPGSADISLERPAKRTRTDVITATVGAEPSDIAYTAEIAEVVPVTTPPDASLHLDTDWVNQCLASPMSEEAKFQFAEEDFQLRSSFNL